MTSLTDKPFSLDKKVRFNVTEGTKKAGIIWKHF